MRPHHQYLVKSKKASTQIDRLIVRERLIVALKKKCDLMVVGLVAHAKRVSGVSNASRGEFLTKAILLRSTFNQT
jgi:hypothetical protein